MGDDRFGVASIAASIVGLGALAGQKCVVVNFAGCNIWDGSPLHRDEAAAPCGIYCDQCEPHGVVMDTEAILEAMQTAYGESGELFRWCVLTGGEPMIQVTADLLARIRQAGWCIMLETNGVIPLSAEKRCHVNWLVISPPPDAVLPEQNLATVDELRVVYPGAPLGQPGWTDAELAALRAIVAGPKHCLIVPQDPSAEVDDEQEDFAEMVRAHHIQSAAEFVASHPEWRLALRMHRILGLP